MSYSVYMHSATGAAKLGNNMAIYTVNFKSNDNRSTVATVEDVIATSKIEASRKAICLVSEEIARGTGDVVAFEKTKIISVVELNVGDIVHFYGARFEITCAVMFRQDDDHIRQFGHIGPTMAANGKWLDGATQTGYFGPGKDWNFQGNKGARVTVEIAA